LREKITSKRLVLLAVAAAAALAVAVPAALAGTTYINGQLSPGDTVQTDRLFRDGIPSQCTYLFNPFPPQNIIGTSKTDPGRANILVATRRADVYSFSNLTPQFQCVTVRLVTNCGPFDPLHVNGFAAAYFFYNPNLTVTGLAKYQYAGDAGQSQSPMQFGFGVAPFDSFFVVVSTVGDNILPLTLTAFQNCQNYALTVQIGKTAQTAAIPRVGTLSPLAFDRRVR
jgi:hypothetical protein